MIHPLAQIMEWVFIALCCVGGAAWFYSARYFLPMWASGFRKRPEHEGYMHKTLIGACVMAGTTAAGFAVGGIAELVGGWG